MNRGRARKQSWRPRVEAVAQTPASTDSCSSGPRSCSPDRKPHGSWQTLGRGSGGSIPKCHEKLTPASDPGQRQGWSSYGGESYSRRGRGKQWGVSSKRYYGSDCGYDKNFGSSAAINLRGNKGHIPTKGGAKPLSEVASGSSSLNLDRSFIENVENPSGVSHLSKESFAGDSHSDDRGPETAESVPENENSECSRPLEPFDICLPKSGSVVVLKPSLLAKNREMRNDRKRSGDGPKWFILRSGMVLLKNYLSSSEQVKIIRLCQKHGRDPAGFYQPRFRDGGKLHLHLMCFGKFWDAESNKYGDVRPMDCAKPPPMPQEFLQLVDRAMKDSHSLIAKDSSVKNAEDALPLVKPDICLVNYYAKTGQLGLHQDKDESRETLDKGIPIVSFSIGDSAEFLYSDQRDAEKAEKVILESGDILIFGGYSRHIFHGVSTILPDTAPKSLLEETNFRPGRLNLTFRQHH